jgi:hypothetical protein
MKKKQNPIRMCASGRYLVKQRKKSFGCKKYLEKNLVFFEKAESFFDRQS